MEDLCTSLLLNCLRCKRYKKKKTDLTLHCTNVCIRFLSYFYRGKLLKFTVQYTRKYLICIYVMNCFCLFLYTKELFAELLVWVYIVI